MDLFWQLTVTGLLTGVVYALLGVSWGLIYGTTRTFHFAHGLAYACAAYAAVAATQHLAGNLVVGIVAGVLGAMVVGLACELLVYAPLRRRATLQLGIFLASLGILIAGQSFLQIGFGPDAQTLKVPSLGIQIWGPVAASRPLLLSSGIAAVLVLALALFLQRTRLGREIRATARNYDLAELVGIRSPQVYALTFAIGSAMIGPAAVLFALDNVATPQMGVSAVLYAFIAVFLGGLESLWGAVIGGIALGLIAQWSSLWLPAYWQTTAAFALFFLVLVLRPAGILGRVAR